MTATITVEFGPGMLQDALEEAARIATTLQLSVKFTANDQPAMMMANGEVVIIGAVTWARVPEAPHFERWQVIP